MLQITHTHTNADEQEHLRLCFCVLDLLSDYNPTPTTRMGYMVTKRN
jgi:hypothetical protein